MQPRRRKVLWVDAHANLQVTTRMEGLRRLLGQAREAGFTTVVIDVKPTTGEVLYDSALAPRLIEWGEVRVPDGWDLLARSLEAARSVGLEVFASLNIFVEGYRHEGRMRGAIVQGRPKPEWESVGYGRLSADPGASGLADPAVSGPTWAGLAPISHLEGHPWAFVNPLLDEVVEYELALLEEVVRNYPVDGIILDRARYDGLASDFSPATRKALSDALESVEAGRDVPGASALAAWPGAVYRYVDEGTGGAIRTSTGQWVLPGPLFGHWLQLRARAIRRFVEQARSRLKAIRGQAEFGVYAGSWAPIYHELGANWMDPSNPSTLAVVDPQVRPYLSSSYHLTGYADLLDLFMSGNYYPDVRVCDHSPEWQTVEGAARLVRNVMPRSLPVYGSLFLQQYQDHPERVGEAIRACLQGSDGVMVFDSCYLDLYGWWGRVQEGLAWEAQV